MYMKKKKDRNRIYHTQCLFKHVTLFCMKEKERRKKNDFQVLSIRKHIYYIVQGFRFSLFEDIYKNKKHITI
jgi:hypothetical protein